MHDWGEIVEERLGKLGSTPQEQEGIVAELAGHLEELYAELRSEGLDDSQAVARAMAEVADGRRLARKIRTAKESYMNDRTRHFWLPGLASLLAASLFLAVFARVSYLPHMLVVRSGLALMMYPAWLIVQPVFGGIGAYFSRRAGGNRLTRILAALSPSIALLALVLIGVVVQIVMASVGKPSDIGSMGSLAFARAMLFAIVMPSLALLIGALPFLRDGAKAA